MTSRVAIQERTTRDVIVKSVPEKTLKTTEETIQCFMRSAQLYGIRLSRFPNGVIKPGFAPTGESLNDAH